MGHPREVSCGKWSSPRSPPAAPTLLAQQVQKKEVISPILCRIKFPREVEGSSFSHMAIPEPITGQETGHPDWPDLGLVLHPRGQQWGRHLGESSVRNFGNWVWFPKEKLLFLLEGQWKIVLDGHKIKQTKPATTTQAK